MILALAALLALAVIATRQSRGGVPGAPTLDANLPANVRAVVLQALKTEIDTHKLRTLAATLPGYPKTQAALEARAKLLDGLIQKNADKIAQLLGAIRDPSWRAKVQGFLSNVSDLLSLEILAAALSVGEPAAASVLRLKIAALQGKADYAPKAPPPAADDPGVLNLFPSGQYQGADEQQGFVAKSAKFGNGQGPLGLDPGVAALTPEAQTCLTWLLVTLPASFAKSFPASPIVQGDPAGSLAETLNAVDAAIRARLPMAGTSLRMKARFVLANKTALNLAAKTALAAAQAHTGMTMAAALAEGAPVIVGEGPEWLRAQHPEHGYHSGQWSAIEDHMGQSMMERGRMHAGEWSAIEDHMGQHYLARPHTGEWSAIEDHMGQSMMERGRMHAGEWSAIEDHMGQHYLARPHTGMHYLDRPHAGMHYLDRPHTGVHYLDRMHAGWMIPEQAHAGEWSAIEDHMGWMIGERAVTAPEIRYGHAGAGAGPEIVGVGAGPEITGVAYHPVWTQAGWMLLPVPQAPAIDASQVWDHPAYAKELRRVHAGQVPPGAMPIQWGGFPSAGTDETADYSWSPEDYLDASAFGMNPTPPSYVPPGAMPMQWGDGGGYPPPNGGGYPVPGGVGMPPVPGGVGMPPVQVMPVPGGVGMPPPAPGLPVPGGVGMPPPVRRSFPPGGVGMPPAGRGGPLPPWL